MDLSVIGELIAYRDDSLCANTPLPTLEPSRTVLDATLGPKPEFADSYVTAEPSVFMTFVIALLKMGHIWEPKDLSGKPDTKNSRPMDMAVSLVKKLMVYMEDPSGKLRIHRLRRALFVEHRLLIVKNEGPRDWEESVRKVRQLASEVSHKDLKKECREVKTWTLEHALIAMCIESVVDRPLQVLDDGMPASLSPTTVWANDLSEVSESVWDSLQESMDAVSLTFCAFMHCIGALTRVYISALRNENVKVPHLKEAEEKHDNISNVKQTTIIWRNLITDLAIFWIASKDFIIGFMKKDLKHIETNVENSLENEALHNFIVDTLHWVAKARLFSKQTCDDMTRLAILSQGLLIRLADMLHDIHLKKNIREKFILCDFVTIHWTSFEPEASIVGMIHGSDVKFTCMPDRWTLLSMEQMGLENFFKSQTFDGSKEQIQALTTLSIFMTKSMSNMWHMLQHWQPWEGGARNELKPLLPMMPSGADLEMPSWMPTQQEEKELRALWKKTYREAEQMQMDAILASLEFFLCHCGHCSRWVIVDTVQDGSR